MENNLVTLYLVYEIEKIEKSKKTKIEIACFLKNGSKLNVVLSVWADFLTSL